MKYRQTRASLTSCHALRTNKSLVFLSSDQLVEVELRHVSVRTTIQSIQHVHRVYNIVCLELKMSPTIF